MFYWFYRTTHPDGYRNRPIILWLQGGPGYSGTGIGNFLEVGPLDQNLKARNASWVKTANLLFVDNPAGVGFSITGNERVGYDIEDISNDLISVLKTFMKEHSYFESNPLYIFGQSYGGKMAAGLTYYLHKSIEKKEIQWNLKGLGIGNGFVSPADTIASWPSVVYQMSLIDDVQYKHMNEIGVKALKAAEEGEWETVGNAFQLMSKIDYIPALNPYKLTDITVPYDEWSLVHQISINDFMNNAVRDKLGVIPNDTFWPDSKSFFYIMDFWSPCWHLIDEILKSSGIDVVVYSGQFDLICSTSGDLKWMDRLTWEGKKEFDKAERKTILNPKTKMPEMFVKSYNNLKMYWVLDAGHVVPVDVPDTALRMVNRILDNVDYRADMVNSSTLNSTFLKVFIAILLFCILASTPFILHIFLHVGSI